MQVARIQTGRKESALDGCENHTQPAQCCDEDGLEGPEEAFEKQTHAVCQTKCTNANTRTHTAKIKQHMVSRVMYGGGVKRSELLYNTFALDNLLLLKN